MIYNIKHIFRKNIDLFSKIYLFYSFLEIFIRINPKTTQDELRLRHNELAVCNKNILLVCIYSIIFISISFVNIVQINAAVVENKKVIRSNFIKLCNLFIIIFIVYTVFIVCNTIFIVCTVSKYLLSFFI